MKRILTIGVVFIFIGLAVAPSLNAYIPEIIKQVKNPVVNTTYFDNIFKDSLEIKFSCFYIIIFLFDILYELTDGFYKFTPIEYVLYMIFVMIALIIYELSWSGPL